MKTGVVNKMSDNKKRSKAISVRYTFDKFDELVQMKDSYCEMTGRDLSTNQFIKQMVVNGFLAFKKLNDEVWAEIDKSSNLQTPNP